MQAASRNKGVVHVCVCVRVCTEYVRGTVLRTCSYIQDTNLVCSNTSTPYSTPAKPLPPKKTSYLQKWRRFVVRWLAAVRIWLSFAALGLVPRLHQRHPGRVPQPLTRSGSPSSGPSPYLDLPFVLFEVLINLTFPPRFDYPTLLSLRHGPQGRRVVSPTTLTNELTREDWHPPSSTRWVSSTSRSPTLKRLRSLRRRRPSSRGSIGRGIPASGSFTSTLSSFALRRQPLVTMGESAQWP